MTPPRTYEARPKATVTIQDDGTIEVEVDLINLPSQIMHDYLAGQSDTQAASDAERIHDAFMSSPTNHTISTTLHQ